MDKISPSVRVETEMIFFSGRISSTLIGQCMYATREALKNETNLGIH